MRILLADDHDLFREGFALVIQTLFPQIQVIEQVASWQTLRVAAQQQVWDLIILDLCMSSDQRWDVELEQFLVTERQKQVLNLLALGKSNKQIAQQLGVSESTIKRHVYNMYKIMSVNNRVEAIDYARQRGLILN